MSWAPVAQSFWTHRKTYALADALAIDEVHAGGLVARLWSWAIDNAHADYVNQRGLLSNIVPRAIAGAAGWKGEAVAFVEALIRVGFLDHDGDELVLHDWWEYSGRLLERRRKDRDRKRAARAAAAKKPVSRPKASPQDTARNVPTVSDVGPALTVQYSRVESVNAPPTPPSDDGGVRARAAALIEVRAVPKPWEVARATCEVHHLFPTLVELFGQPPRPEDWEARRDDLLAFDALGATPETLQRRAANYDAVMGRRRDGTALLLTPRALITHWVRLGIAPEPEHPPEVRGMVVPIPPAPRMTREQGAAYRREILEDVRRAREARGAATNKHDAENLSPAGGRDAGTARTLGGD